MYVVLVWIVGIICIPVMKKILPEVYKLYAVYVLAVLVAFTAFVIHYSQQL